MQRPSTLLALAIVLPFSAQDLRAADTAPAPTPVPSEATPAAPLFAAVTTPSAGAPQVFGTYARGCIAGARQLPLDSPRWQVLRPSRNRSWGHPELLRFVGQLAQESAEDGFPGLLVGDLAQPRGGPTVSAHHSHQVGLDVDVWLAPMPRRRVPAHELETFAPKSMVDLARRRVTRAFGARQIALLRRAAQAPEVERIFVSPVIKRALCERVKGDRSWLRKVRPWVGHVGHMHARLQCPAGSRECTPQEPPPPGDGCGAELRSWFEKPDWASPKAGAGPHDPVTLGDLPAACRELVAGST